MICNVCQCNECGFDTYFGISKTIPPTFPSRWELSCKHCHNKQYEEYKGGMPVLDNILKDYARLWGLNKICENSPANDKFPLRVGPY